MKSAPTAIFATVGLVILSVAAGCAPERATYRLSDIEFRPDVGDKREWSFRFDDEGKLDRFTVEVAGTETSERTYRYNDAGELEQVDFEQPNDTFSFEYRWAEGRVSSIEAEQSIDEPDDNQTGSISVGVEYSYTDGQLAQVVTTSLVQYRVDQPLLKYDVRNEEVETQKYEFDDQGRLSRAKTDIEAEAATDFDADIIPDTNEREETSADEDYTYDDSGNIVRIEGDIAYDGPNDDDEATASSEDTFRFDDEGKLTDSETEVKYEVGADFNDEWSYSYDENGRLVEMENDEGDQYEFSYDEGDMRSLTFGMPSGTPGAALFDLNGRGFYLPPSPLVLTP